MTKPVKAARHGLKALCIPPTQVDQALFQKQVTRRDYVGDNFRDAIRLTINFRHGTVLLYQVKLHALAPWRGALVFVDHTSTAPFCRPREATAT
jgi:hypothetical protein